MAGTICASLASYDHVSSMERNVFWVRVSCPTGAISRVVRSRIFDDREKCIMGANVSHDGRISRVVQSCIFDDREKCAMGANGWHNGRISRVVRSRIIVLWVRVSCPTGPSLASYDQVSSTIERNVFWVRVSCTTGASLASYDHVS